MIFFVQKAPFLKSAYLGLNIPDGGVHIIGGDNGEAFITFSSDEDGRLAMLNNNKDLSGSKVSLFLSSKTEMQAKIDELRSGAALISQEPAYANTYAVQTSQFFPHQQNLGPNVMPGNAPPSNRYTVLGETPQHASYNSNSNSNSNTYDSSMQHQQMQNQGPQFQYNSNIRQRMPSQMSQQRPMRGNAPSFNNRPPMMERGASNFMDQQRPPQRPSLNNQFNPMRGPAPQRNAGPTDQHWQNSALSDSKTSTPDHQNVGSANSFAPKQDPFIPPNSGNQDMRGMPRGPDSRPPFRQPGVRAPLDAKGMNPRFNAPPSTVPSRNVRPGAFDMVRGSARPGAPFQRGMAPQGPQSGQIEHNNTPQGNFTRPPRPRFPNVNNPELDPFNKNSAISSSAGGSETVMSSQSNQQFPSNFMNSGGINNKMPEFFPQQQPKDMRMPAPSRSSDGPNNSYGNNSFVGNESASSKPNFDQFRNPALLPGEVNNPPFNQTNVSSQQQLFPGPKNDLDRNVASETKERSGFEQTLNDFRNKTGGPYLFPGESRSSPSVDEDRRHRKRSSSRERHLYAGSDNKRLHYDEKETRASSSRSDSFKHRVFYYMIIDHAPIDVKDSDIREFLSDAGCKTNMRPIILARRNHCLVFLRFDDERLSRKCLQLSGRRFKAEVVKVSESSKKQFDEAYVEFQSEINREIYIALKSNNYKGDFVRIEGLPDNVTNDEIMNEVFSGEKLQVDDIYIEYSPGSTLDEPYVGYVRTACRRDAERLCQSHGKSIEGRYLRVFKISEGQYYQSIKDHQAKVSMSSSKTDAARSSAADSDYGRESRRRSAARMTESAESTRSRDRESYKDKEREKEKEKEKEIKTKQCPDDVCVEIYDLPPRTEKKDIREFFKKLKVMHVVFDPEDERRVYVEFEKEREQVVALRMNRQRMGDISVKIMAIESAEYLKRYMKYKNNQASSESKETFEKSSSELSAESLDFSRSSKRSAYPKQFYKILFLKPLCTSLDVLRKFLEVTFESHIVLKKDQGGFTTEAYLTTCENPPSHFMALEGKSFCSVGVTVCKISEEDFKMGTNSIQPSMFTTQIVRPDGPPLMLNNAEPQKPSVPPKDNISTDSGISTAGNDEKSLDNCMIKISCLPLRVAGIDVEKFLSGIKVRANGIAMFPDKREALVILENAAEKARALSLNNSTFIGCQVQIVPCFIPEAMARFPLAQFRPIAIADMEPVTDKHTIALISGIPKTCEAKQLQELLKPCKIASVTFMRAVSTAFVQMQTSVDAQLCQLKNGYSIGQSQVNVTLKTKAEMDKMIAEFKKKGSTGSLGSQPPLIPSNSAPSGSSVQSSKPESPKTHSAPTLKSTPFPAAVASEKPRPFQPKIDIKAQQPQFAVHLTNLPPTVIKKDIIQLFCNLMLDEKRIVLQPAGKRDTSEAVVLLTNISECKAAQELNQTFLGPRKIIVRILERGEIMPIISSYGNLVSPYQVPLPSNHSNANTSGFDPITLRLSGLPIDVTAPDILDFFKDFNPNPELLAINNDSITRACTAQLSFNNRTMGMKALESKQGQFLGGRRILITVPSAS